MNSATPAPLICLNFHFEDYIRKLKRSMVDTQQPLYRICFFLIVLSVSSSEAFNVDFDFLPSDESDAVIYLEEKVLDSSLWKALVPFYHKPLSVPAGELSYLKPLFPDDEESFPTAQSILVAYQPWDATAIDRFLSDYPLLMIFRPLLVFNYHKKHIVDEIAIHMNDRGDGTSVAHNARFSVSSTRNLILQGTADITSASARWERRVVTFTPVSGLSVQCGNVSLFSEKGLIYGYFPEAFKEESRINDNWLYGDATMWNGVAAGYVRDSNGRVPTLSFKGFYHKRPTETISGSTLSAQQRGVRLSLAVSRAEYTDHYGKDIFVHGSFRKRWKGVFTEMNTALTTGKAIKLPILWHTGYTIGAGKAGFSLIHMPAGIYAPRSSMFRRCLSELNNDDTLFYSASMLRFNVTTPSIGILRLVPRIDIWFRGADADHGKAVLSGDVTWKSIRGHFQLIHTVSNDNSDYGDGSINGKIRMRITNNIQAEIRSRLFFDEYHISSFYGSVQPVFNLYSRFDLRPLFSYQHLKTGDSRYVIGMQQQLTLFDRTTTSFSFKKIITTRTAEDDFHIDTRAVLFF